MAPSPLENTEGPLGIEIKLNGAQLDDSLIIQSVRVRHALNRIPEARFTIKADTVELEDFSLLDSTDVALGTEVEIGGFYGSNEVQTIFKGILTAYRLRVDGAGGARLEVTCRDKAIGLTETRTSKGYLEMTDSDIMSAIIGDAGLTADITATSAQAPLNLRVGASDWDFLRLLADRNGHVLAVDDGKITSAPMDTSAAAALTVTMGEDIVDMDVTVDAQRMIGSASNAAWSEATQEKVSGEGNLPSDGNFGNTTLASLAAVLSERVYTSATAREFAAADLSTFAEARTARASLAAISGFVKFQGSGAIAPTQTLEVAGTGERFGGTGYVTGIEHELDAGVWSTTARMGLPPDWITDRFGVAAPPAEALTAPVQGLQIGKVMQVAEDPDGKQRIQISLPMIGDPAAEVWARYATPYASANAGIQFLPEVDDEVVVAFLNNDPNAPVIVGSLHNAKAERSVEATTENFIKTIRTPTELRLTFDDDKRIITIATPGGHIVTMDDDATSISLKDSNGNSIVMDGSGITMTTDFDITMTASGNISASATQDATVSGANVTCDGQMGFTGTGGSSAEVSSGGMTKVEGSMVNIN